VNANAFNTIQFNGLLDTEPVTRRELITVLSPYSTFRKLTGQADYLTSTVRRLPGQADPGQGTVKSL
jgi:hypothetical protein